MTDGLMEEQSEEPLLDLLSPLVLLVIVSYILTKGNFLLYIILRYFLLDTDFQVKVFVHIFLVYLFRNSKVLVMCLF